MAIKLFKPYTSWKAIWYAVRVLMGTQLAEGEWVKRFERAFANKFGFTNVLALNSGTSALELAFELAGIKEGDEVITPVLTCVATNIPLLHRKAKIVFADINLQLTIDVSDVERKISAKTKAIVFVHFGGNNHGLKEILAIARKHNIPVIEDAAQAVGSDFWGKADFTCVSLQAIKTLNSVDGGFLICKNKLDHEIGKRLRWFGYDRAMKQRHGDTDLTDAGYKYHMNNVTAAIGLGNLHSIDKVIAHRKELMAIYKEWGLSGGIWMMGGYAEDYKALEKYAAQNGIEIGQHHYRNDKYTIFGGRQEFKNMDALENHYYFVPMHYGVTAADALRVAKTVTLK